MSFASNPPESMAARLGADFPYLVDIANDVLTMAADSVPSQGAPYGALRRLPLESVNRGQGALEDLFQALIHQESSDQIGSVVVPVVETLRHAVMVAIDDAQRMLNEAEYGREALQELVGGAIEMQDRYAAYLRLESARARASNDRRVSDALVSQVQESRDAVEEQDNRRGELGSLELGRHYQRMAARERRTADYLRILAVLIFSAAAVTAVVQEGAGIASSWQQALGHLPYVLALLALSSYLVSESGRHRKTSRWAETTAAQLETVDLFTAPMGPDDTSKVRMMLADKVFISSDPEAGAADVASALPAPSAASLEQIAAIVRASRG